MKIKLIRISKHFYNCRIIVFIQSRGNLNKLIFVFNREIFNAKGISYLAEIREIDTIAAVCTDRLTSEMSFLTMSYTTITVIVYKNDLDVIRIPLDRLQFLKVHHK